MTDTDLYTDVEKMNKALDATLKFFDEGVEQLLTDLEENGDTIIIDGRIDPRQLVPAVIIAGMLPKGELAQLYIALTAREAMRRRATA